MCVHVVAPVQYIVWTVFEDKRAYAGTVFQWVITSTLVDYAFRNDLPN